METNTKAVFIERDCVFNSKEGRQFEAGGAVVTPDFIIGYPRLSGVMADWHGNPLGTWREVSRWRVNSYMGTHMLQIEATVDGVTYTGRGFGEGMIYRGKRKAQREVK